MMKTHESKHVIPESQETNFQFAKSFPNSSETGRNDDSRKYAYRYRPATHKEAQEDIQPNMPSLSSPPIYTHNEGKRGYENSYMTQDVNPDQRYHK